MRWAATFKLSTPILKVRLDLDHIPPETMAKPTPQSIVTADACTDAKAGVRHWRNAPTEVDLYQCPDCWERMLAVCRDLGSQHGPGSGPPTPRLSRVLVGVRPRFMSNLRGHLLFAAHADHSGRKAVILMSENATARTPRGGFWGATPGGTAFPVHLTALAAICGREVALVPQRGAPESDAVAAVGRRDVNRTSPIWMT